MSDTTDSPREGKTEGQSLNTTQDGATSPLASKRFNIWAAIFWFWYYFAKGYYVIGFQVLGLAVLASALSKHRMLQTYGLLIFMVGALSGEMVRRYHASGRTPSANPMANIGMLLLGSAIYFGFVAVFQHLGWA
ncbi:hypothetical protein WDW37_11865 [Bdellovibrionota bacterium FG-1]